MAAHWVSVVFTLIAGSTMRATFCRSALRSASHSASLAEDNIGAGMSIADRQNADDVAIPIVAAEHCSGDRNRSASTGYGSDDFISQLWVHGITRSSLDRLLSRALCHNRQQ